MDIRVCVTVICAVAGKCYLDIMIGYDRQRVSNTRPVCLDVSVCVDLGSLHVFDWCLQHVLCAKMHYGAVHDYIQ